jgi:glycosyltransferase involved in cell wall biosynthesis
MSYSKNSQFIDVDQIPCEEISDSKKLIQNPLVSTITATYNHRPYINQAIEGILQQKVDFPIELLIGEDCSTDGTREIVLEYQKKYPDLIRVITSEKNVGMPHNAFRTRKKARGKYIALCEGDDYWFHPEKLKWQIDILESNPDIGLVYCGYIKHQVEYGRKIPWTPLPEDYDTRGDAFLRIMGNDIAVKTPTVCFRRELLEKIIEDNPDVFFNKNFAGWDNLMWRELSRITRFRLINEPLVMYNRLSESATNSRNPNKIIAFKKACYVGVEHLMNKYNCPKDLVYSKHYVFNTELLKLSFLGANKKVAIEALNKLKEQGIDLSLKHWIYFYGASNAFGRFIVSSFIKPYLMLRRNLIVFLYPKLKRFIVYSKSC